MAQVFPFEAVRYHNLNALGSLTAPPYDVITAADQQALYDASPHNVVRLELARPETQKAAAEAGSGEDPYLRASHLLDSWLQEGVLVREPAPACYVYQQSYQLPGQEPRTRTGFFAEVGLEEFSTGVILPHEETFAGPKQDRLRLLRACRANISPLFGLYREVPAISQVLQAASRAPALATYHDSTGITNRLWRVSDRDALEVINHGLEDRSILIADGHHRYETALAYRRERRAAAPAPAGDGWYDRALFVLVSMGDPGLVVLPTHRILRQVDARVFESWQSRVREAVPGTTVKSLAQDPAAIRAALAAPGGGPRFVLVAGSGAWLLELPVGAGTALEALDVSRLHRQILPAVAGSSDPHDLDIAYTQDLEVGMGAVRSGAAPAALLMNPTPVERVDAVAATGARMPEKSTYFYPKLSTGAVLRVEPREWEAGRRDGS